MHLVIPIYYSLEKKLIGFPAEGLVCVLISNILKYLKEKFLGTTSTYHAVASFLHPVLRNFLFCMNISTKNSYQEDAKVGCLSLLNDLGSDLIDLIESDETNKKN